MDEALLAGNIGNARSGPLVPRSVAAPPGRRPPGIVRAAGTLRPAGTGGPRTENLVVAPGDHRLEFLFTGLSLVAPEKVRFRYRLISWEKNWIEAGAQRRASYNHVPPGTYRFEVTACNNDGVWNEDGASVGLVVLPPWWTTWWFRGLMELGVAGLVFGWYEQRLHRLRHGHQAQESLSQETNPPGTAARLKDIAETARKALQQARRHAGKNRRVLPGNRPAGARHARRVHPLRL